MSFGGGGGGSSALSGDSDVALNSPASGEYLGYDSTSDKWTNSNPIPGTIQLDSFSGADDDAKLTAALTYVQTQSNMPAIQLPSRNLAFTAQRTPFSGLKILGSSGEGPKNLEISSGQYVSNKVTISCSGAWWVGTGTYYDIYFANIAFNYTNSSSFWSQASGTLYACEFHALSHNGAVGVFGSAATKALMTQVIFSGHWTVLNGSDVQFHIGGSDNNFWTDGYMNIQNPSVINGAGKFLCVWDFLQKTNIANIYCTATDGWRGMKVVSSTGSGNGYGLNFSGCRTEGANDSSQCDGNAFLVTGGGVSIRDHWTMNAMGNPSGTEHGIIEITGGDVSIDRLCYNHGATLNSVPLVYVSGGTLRINSAASATGETLFVDSAGGTVVADSSVSVI